MESIPVYIVLGTRGSERRSVVAGLVRDEFDPEPDSCRVYLPSADAGDEASEPLRHLKQVALAAYDSGSGLDFGEVAATDTKAVFVILDDRRDLVDQLEALKPKIAGAGFHVGRVICAVNLALMLENPKLEPWYQGCFHFSDVILLGARERVPNKQVSEIKKKLEGEFPPAVIAVVKKGRVAHAPQILFPEPRRVSQFLDDLAPDADVEGEEVLFQVEGKEADFEDYDDAVLDAPVVDPYMERDQSGRRVRPLPDIYGILP